MGVGDILVLHVPVIDAECRITQFERRRLYNELLVTAAWLNIDRELLRVERIVAEIRIETEAPGNAVNVHALRIGVACAASIDGLDSQVRSVGARVNESVGELNITKR